MKLKSFTITPRFDSRVVTRNEFQNVLAFIRKKQVPNTSKKSSAENKQRLENISYQHNCHDSYTFMYEDKDDTEYGPDVRHIFIKELNSWISLL